MFAKLVYNYVNSAVNARQYDINMHTFLVLKLGYMTVGIVVMKLV